MTKKEKAQAIGRILDGYFPEPEIPLTHSSPYTLLIAVLLSAQCTDERVNKVTPELFARATTAREMAALSVAQIQGIIRSCGLAPQKAKAIKALSEILVDRYQGDVPTTLEELEALPGVGHKTASVVMVQAFHVPAFPVDTHTHRLAYRWGLSSGKNVTTTERDLKELYPEKQWA
ncbi:MAG: endonuclease III, partial [Bdellovibrionales bacterium]|nr:endonuclease III [Bdellovibrionales bacterium]